MQCFVAIAETGSMSAAARLVGITQPAISHSLNALQRELELRLFERRGQGMTLTTAGRSLLPWAQRSVNAERSLTALSERMADRPSGQLRVGCCQLLTTRVFPSALRHWSTQFPDVQVGLVEYDSAEDVGDAVNAGDVDLGVTSAPPSWGGTVVELGREPLVVVLPHSHPLAGRKMLSVEDLAGQPLVLYDRGTDIGAWTDQLLSRRGVRAPVVARTRQALAAPVLAASGIGAAIVPASTLPADYSGALVPLQPEEGRTVVAIKRRSEDPLIDAFIGAIVIQMNQTNMSYK